MKINFSKSVATIFPFLFYLFLLTSCFKSYPRKSTLLSVSGTFPAPPAHNHNVEFYLPNDTVKDSSFIQITDLTVADWPDTESEKFAEEMTKLAQKNGVDVVKLKNWENEVNNNGNTYKLLKGMGYRYEKHMDYLHKYLKWEQVSYLPENGSNPVLAVTTAYDFDHNIWKIIPEDLKDGEKLFKNFVYRYSPYHLINETKNWVYKKGEPGFEKIRVHKEKNIIDKKLKLVYQDKKVVKIIIDNTTLLDEKLNSIKEQIDLTYDEQYKHIIKSDIKSLNGKFYQYSEEFFYANNKLNHSIMSEIVDGKKIPFVRTDYEYFSIKDFK